MKKSRTAHLHTIYRKYKYNLTAYLLLVFTLFITLRITYSFLYIDLSDGKYTLADHLVSCMRSISDAVIISIPFWLAGKKCKGIFFAYLLIVELMLLSCIWYYRNFETVIPYTTFLMPGNLNGLGPSILASVRIKDMLVILPALLFTLFYHRILISKTEDIPFKKRLVFASACILFSLPVQIHAGWNNYSGCGERRIHILRHYGLFHIFRFDILSHRPCTEAEQKEIEAFISQNQKKQVRRLSSGKNLILILTESFTSWPIGLKVGREEMTPFLNKLIEQDSAMYFPHVLPQTSDGRSSDAQLIINTGLLPIRSGAVATLFGTNEFYSIPKALAGKGYQSFNFICDEPDFWYQGTTSKSYGFDTLFDKYKLGSKGQKLNDKQLFEAVLPRLTALKRPFYAQIVTLSTHYPFQESTCPNPGDSVLRAGLPDKEVAYFLAAVRYTDRQIGTFIQKLKEAGLYQNSIILITGDHEDIPFNRFKGIKRTSLSDRYIPLIILNAPCGGGRQEAVIGQCDIYPTILELMGVDDYAFTGLGNSMLGPIDDCAVFRTGEVAGKNRQEAVIGRKKLSWKISDLIIRCNYFKK